MPILKKLIFAPAFLLIFAFLFFQLNSYFYNYEFIFSLSLNNLYQFICLSILILLSSLAFALFVSFASDWRFIVPAIILGSLLPYIFTPPSLGIILTSGILISLLIVYFTLENSLKNYVTFHPFHIFGPPIRNLSFLLILTFSISYYFSVNLVIQEKGFQIPDSLLDSSLKFIPKPEVPTESQTQPQIQIPPEQIELLKQNPALLKQYGLDPSILDNIPSDKPQSVSQFSDAFLKEAVKSQLDQILKPYISYIPLFLGILFFITIQSITSFLNILIYPLLWLIFYLLEKSKFIQFTTEMRPVKKMVV